MGVGMGGLIGLSQDHLGCLGTAASCLQEEKERQRQRERDQLETKRCTMGWRE